MYVAYITKTEVDRIVVLGIRTPFFKKKIKTSDCFLGIFGTIEEAKECVKKHNEGLTPFFLHGINGELFTPTGDWLYGLREKVKYSYVIRSDADF